VVAENLLQSQASVGLFDGDPHHAANQLVEKVWERRPHIFTGRFGRRPHKISVAAIAFAEAIERIEEDDENPGAMRLSFANCLGGILSELETNGRLYPLYGVDFLLLEEAVAVFKSFSEEVDNSPLAQEMEGQGLG